MSVTETDTPFTSFDAATETALKDPQPGDRFSEFLSFWQFVIWRDGDDIAWMEATGGQTLPRDGVLRAGTIVDFRAVCHGFYVGRTPVDGWLDWKLAEFAAERAS